MINSFSHVKRSKNTPHLTKGIISAEESRFTIPKSEELTQHYTPRKCMGYRLAHFESVAAVVAVVRRFVVRTAFEDDFYIEQTHRFVCKPASEIWVKIRSRS